MRLLNDVFKLTILTTLIIGQVYGCDEEDTKDAYQIFLEEKEEVNVHTFAHIKGNVQEKNWKQEHISFFHAISYNIEILMNCDADVVCIQNIASHRLGRECYQLLKERYAHFYVETCGTCPQFIASKYEIRDPYYIPLNENEGLFDFILTDAQGSIGHFYCTQSNNLFVSTHLLQIILEKIDMDFRNAQEEIPFILCGNFDVGMEMLEYFEGTGGVFLLKVPSLVTGYPLENRYAIETTQIRPCQGAVSFIHWKHAAEQVGDSGYIFLTAHTNDDGSISENNAGISGGYDREGNARVEGHFNHETWDREGGSTSFELKGEVSRDKDGNTNAEVKGSLDFKW